MDIVPLPRQVGQERRLTQPGLGLENENAVVVLPEERIDPFFDPLPAGEPVELHPLEDRPGVKIGIGQPLVVADEELVVVPSGEDTVDRVATDRDAPLSRRLHAAHSPPRSELRC